MRHHRLALALILLLAAVHRTIMAVTNLVAVTYDSGSVGIMALRILEGERPLMLYGFNYTGALLPYLTAALFKVAGASLVTLSLPPILFAMAWCGATYLLFREWFDERTALAAALCVAVADMITTYYSTIPDCAYSPMFFLGTVTLWLAVRVSRRALSAPQLWLHVLAMGLTAGLALWTHPLTLSYLACGAIVLVPFFLTNRFHPRILLPFAAGAILFVIALAPLLTVVLSLQGSGVVKWNLEPVALRYCAKLFMHTALPWMLYWPPLDLPAWVKAGVGILLCAALLGYSVHVVTTRGRKNLGASLFPLLFIAVFLVFYFPHQLASTGAPRYLIPFWTMTLFALFAIPLGSPHRWLRIPVTVLFAVWLGYNTWANIQLGRQRAPGKWALLEQYRTLVRSAGEAEADFVYLVGEYDWSTTGQTLSFLAKDKVRFLGADEERHEPTAQRADASAAAAFCAADRVLDRLVHALEGLDAEFELDIVGDAGLAHTIRLDPTPRRSIPAGELQVRLFGPRTGAGERLVDRTRGTHVIGYSDRTHVLVDLGKERAVAGVAFGPVQVEGYRLPWSARVQGSVDGETLFLIKDVGETLPMVYASGGRVYAGAGYGVSEVRFEPATAAYLLLSFPVAPHVGPTWTISEVFVFESAPQTGDGKGDVLPALSDAGPRFVAADRWISANILKSEPGRAWPRYNNHFEVMETSDPNPSRDFVPAPGNAVVVSHAFADDSEAVLRDAYGEVLHWSRMDYRTHVLLQFENGLEGDDTNLWWNGVTLLRR